MTPGSGAGRARPVESVTSSIEAVLRMGGALPAKACPGSAYSMK